MRVRLCVHVFLCTRSLYSSITHNYGRAPAPRACAYACVCECVRACEGVLAFVCLRACVRVCARAHQCTYISLSLSLSVSLSPSLLITYLPCAFWRQRRRRMLKACPDDITPQTRNDKYTLLHEYSPLWTGSKRVVNFPWIFHAMRSLVPAGHFRNISEHLFTWLVCGSFQWRHGLLFTDCIVWDDKDKVFGFKKSHWIHLGWRSTGSRKKLQLFQSSQHSHVTNCRLISSSPYFPWNTTLKYKMEQSEGYWDKILHAKSRTQCLLKEELFFSRWFVSGSDRPKFWK